jgi:hypothetical protein
MFEHLADFDVILVSGPQRSGTTVCARMVAQDTGHQLIDESEYHFHNEAHWRQIIQIGGKVVVHCPAMCHLVHEFADDERVAIAFMLRDVRDIISSQERIGWTQREEPRELAKYNADYGPVSLVKYEFWARVQCGLFPPERCFEIEYESLAGHPLWVPSEKRVNFGHRQTSL